MSQQNYYERNGAPSIHAHSCRHHWEPTAFQPVGLSLKERREICRKCNSIEYRPVRPTMAEEAASA